MGESYNCGRKLSEKLLSRGTSLQMTVMKILAVFGLLLLTASSAFAQLGNESPRVVVTSTLPQAIPQSKPIATPTPIVASQQKQSIYPQTVAGSNLNQKGLSFAQIKSKIAEAKRFMQTRPIATASVESETPNSLVRIAFYDERERTIDYLVLSKNDFLTPLTPVVGITLNGKQVTKQTIRANGVNTPITITDSNGIRHLPLMIQYPVEKNGRFIETAYYMSTHPGIITSEVVNAGRFYVRNTIDIAREQLRSKGYSIEPKVADFAERLSTVEHVDHLRFRTEPHANIFNDIFTLYALNEGQTYRYSVSSAGAGGMVQMIPATYRMIRARFPNAALMPDFVEGMRNHVNATQAMLLYMQMTWNDLSSNATVQNALATGIARQEHLMAAGYNSNPARLPGYINRGGADWETLIPRETKIYLQIWDSLESLVPLSPRKK